MPSPSLSPQDVSTLIDHLLKTKDPATVGLRRILKSKLDEGKNFPFKRLDLEDFSSLQGESRVFSNDEVRVLELEKRAAELERERSGQRQQAEKAMQAAYQKGRAEGVEQGRTEGKAAAEAEYRKRLREIEDRVVALFADVKREKQELLSMGNRTLVDLALVLARKIVNVELSVNPDIVIAVVKKALEYIADTDRLVVRVAPDDLERVAQKKDLWTSINERLEGISVEPDARVEKGGCLIESSSGVVDARMGVMLDELKDVIDKTWESVMTGEKAVQGRRPDSAGVAIGPLDPQNSGAQKPQSSSAPAGEKS